MYPPSLKKSDNYNNTINGIMTIMSECILRAIIVRAISDMKLFVSRMSECILRARINKIGTPRKSVRIIALTVAMVLFWSAPTAHATTIDDMQSEIDSIKPANNEAI